MSLVFDICVHLPSFVGVLTSYSKYRLALISWCQFVMFLSFLLLASSCASSPSSCFFVLVFFVFFFCCVSMLICARAQVFNSVKSSGDYTNKQFSFDVYSPELSFSFCASSDPEKEGTFDFSHQRSRAVYHPVLSLCAAVAVSVSCICSTHLCS